MTVHGTKALAIAAATVAAVAQARQPPPVLEVPHAQKTVVPTHRFDVDAWRPAVNTHTLLDDAGRGAVPVSEARFLWDERRLLVLFYAGDLDLQIHNSKHDGPSWRDDSFTLSIFVPDAKKALITISATGVVADGMCPDDAADLGDARCDLRWESGVHAGADYDGTINHIGDFDEEWSIQAAIPLKALGVVPRTGTQIAFTVKRCEIAHDGVRSCGSWGDARTPATLVLIK